MAKLVLLYLFLWGISPLTYAQTSYYRQVFEKHTAPERLRAARDVFDKELLLLDSTAALATMKDLKQQAEEIQDAALLIFLTEATALYYKDHYRNDEMPALLHFEAALALAVRYDNPALQAEVYHNMGLLLYRQNKYTQAFEALFKANGIIQLRIGYGQYPFTSRYLYDLGLVYYDFGNFTRAKTYLQEALRYTGVYTVRTIETHNTLGLTYMAMEQFDSAAYHFNKAILLAKALQHSAWTGIASGNLGMIYFCLKQYSAALPLLLADYDLSIKNKEWASAAGTLCLLADIHLLHHNYKAAADALDSALAFDEVQHDDRFLLHYTLTKARLCKDLKQYECAAGYLDSARVLQSSITHRRDGILLAQIEKNMEVEKYLTEMKWMESERSKAVLIRNFIIVVIFLLLMIAAQLIFRQQLKQKKNKELLNNAVYQLNFYIESLQEKNELIEQFQREVDSLHALPDYRNLLKEKEEIADKLKKYTIVTEEHWNEFRHLFEKVQKGFFENLKKQYPGLTQSEVRLMALMKLNLSRKEMAEMLGVSPDSIKKTRQRIRKKISLPEEMDLEGLVISI